MCALKDYLYQLYHSGISRTELTSPDIQ